MKIPNPLAFLTALPVIGVPLVGTVWALLRGGKDFDVFYEASRLLVSGWGEQIYRVSPDRFLYAPGFAGLFTPFLLLPRDWALIVWSVFKAALLIYSLFALLRARSKAAVWAAIAFGMVLIARPLLIDFQYGQINSLLLSVGLLALLSYETREPARARPALIWAALAMLAVSKVFLVPLLAIPWVLTRGRDPLRVKFARVGSALGAVLVLVLPLVIEGPRQGLGLYSEWYVALLSKGLPVESHNQSFAALLLHYLSGVATPVISEGRALHFGGRLLSAAQISALTLAWSALMLSALSGWLLFRGRWHRSVWIAVLLGLLILPSHLVWKPYFVFSLPLAALLWQERSRRWFPVMAVAFFVAINLTGFDFLGHALGARVEAASLLLFTHLGLLALTVRAAVRRSDEV